MNKPSIRGKRKLLGWKQTTTGKAAGVDPTIVCKLECGDIPLTDPRAEKIYRVLDRALRKRAAELNSLLAGTQERKQGESAAPAA